MRVVGYIRISRAEDRDDVPGLARQEADVRAYCEAHGHDLVEVVSEVASARGHRPAFESMLRGLTTGIVVWRLDRLGRRPSDLERVIESIPDDSDILAVMDPALGVGSISGLLTLRIVGAFAAAESDTMGLRIRRALDERAGQGLGHGPRSWGYLPSYSEIVPEEAEVIREMAARVIDGESLASLCRDLDMRGVRTPRGGAWTVGPLGRSLRRPALAGIRVYQGRRISGGIPPILDRGTYEHLQRALRRRSTVRSAAPRLLSGLLYCGVCGHRMYPAPASRGIIYYRCQRSAGSERCGRMNVTADLADETVRAAIEVRLDSDAYREAVRTEPESWGQVEALEARREEIAEDYARGLVSRDTLHAALRVIDEEIARHEVVGAPAPVAWTDDERGVAGLLLSRVECHPPGTPDSTYDPGRLRLVWRV